ncbi:hypothetical protein ACKF11_08905 [Methylobacillus sp. Pita2]|uniref:hypothetical protein n=1 Tax=Methylobacillus sp. Pita2 TaxID=3383245 RepID=UPI0038B551CD
MMDIRVKYTTRVAGQDILAGDYTAARGNALAADITQAVLASGAGVDITAYPVESIAKTFTDPTTGQTVLVGPDGYPLPSSVYGNSLKIKLANTAGFGTIGTGYTFCQRWQLEGVAAGPVEFRFILEFGNNAEFTISSFAVATGRDGSEVNAFNADGSAATWTTASGIVVPAADPDYATNGLVSRVTTPWFEGTMPVKGGAFYSRLIMPSQQAGTVGATGSRPISDWQININSMLPGLKYFANHSSGNYVTANQGAMPNGTINSEFSPVVGVEIRSGGLVRTFTLDAIGDSTTQELATGAGENRKPFNYSWAAKVVNDRILAGLPWGFQNYAYEGKTASHFLGRYKALCTNSIGLTGDIAIIQPFSVNGSGFADTVIDANLLLVQDIIALRKAAGRQTIVRTVFPIKNNAGPTLMAWTRGNRLVRQMDVPVFDAAVLPIVTTDSTHLSLHDSRDIVAPALDRFLINLGL